jgi:hypothetical protein
VKAVEDVQGLGTIPANHLKMGLPLSKQTNSILEVSSSPSISARAVAQWRATLLHDYRSGLPGFVPTKVEKVYELILLRYYEEVWIEASFHVLRGVCLARLPATLWAAWWNFNLPARFGVGIHTVFAD